MRLLQLVYKRIPYICLFVAALFIIAKTGCPIKNILSVQCPTCGMTRAVFSLLKMNLANYCYFNFMAIPTLLSMFIIKFCAEKFYIKLAYVILLINLIYYLFRTFIFRVII